MNFIEAIQTGFRRYGSATGRASRSEYWYWGLFSFLVALVAFGVDLLFFSANSTGPVQTVSGLALLLPSWAVSIRRLHDINRSGYWLLIVFTIVGILLQFYWACLNGTDGDNDYGPDPLLAPAT
jgi:uncharacterized membrane protein YhaH (DUF805 family)